MNEFKGTKGQWYVSKAYKTINDEKGFGIAQENGVRNSKEWEANALLIAEAGNIRQQIPFSLTELKRQRDEMLEMLNSIVENYKSGNEDNFIMSNLIDKSENLIKEATQI